MFFISQAARLRKKTEFQLEKHTPPSGSFFLLTAIAAAIATLGLLLDNTAIIIGAMVVAPLVTPVFGFSLYLLAIQLRRAVISFALVLIGTVIGIAVAAVIGFIIIFIEGDVFSLTNEIIARAQPNLLFFLVALFSGMAGAYAYGRPSISASVTGIAISVAIIPPLAVSGIGIAAEKWDLATQSLLLYFLNLTGIIFGSLIVFIILGFGKEIE
jgi:uncharacterized hydrophobic protein (TIGR00271 family)